jgi:hypothetical protein
MSPRWSYIWLVLGLDVSLESKKEGKEPMRGKQAGPTWPGSLATWSTSVSPSCGPTLPSFSSLLCFHKKMILQKDWICLRSERFLKLKNTQKQGFPFYIVKTKIKEVLYKILKTM